MPYWVKRILLKSGQLLAERELPREDNLYQGPAPVVGDRIAVTHEGRVFDAVVVWGNWPGSNAKRDLSETPAIRVEEL